MIRASWAAPNAPPPVSGTSATSVAPSKSAIFLTFLAMTLSSPCQAGAIRFQGSRAIGPSLPTVGLPGQKVNVPSRRPDAGRGVGQQLGQQCQRAVGGALLLHHERSRGDAQRGSRRGVAEQAEQVRFQVRGILDLAGAAGLQETLHRVAEVPDVW